MQRIQSIRPEQATGRAKELMETAGNMFGMIPNAVGVMANSPAVLDSFLAITKAMGATKIGDKLHT